MPIYTHVLADGLALAVNTAPQAAASYSFRDSVATVIVLFALFGLYAIFKLQGTVRIIVVALVLGLLVVNVGFFQGIGKGIRSILTSIATTLGHPELTGDITFTMFLIILLLIGIVGLLRHRGRDESRFWFWWELIVAFALFTLSWAAKVIIVMTTYLPKVLDYVSQAGQ